MFLDTEHYQNSRRSDMNIEVLIIPRRCSRTVAAGSRDNRYNLKFLDQQV